MGIIAFASNQERQNPFSTLIILVKMRAMKTITPVECCVWPSEGALTCEYGSRRFPAGPYHLLDSELWSRSCQRDLTVTQLRSSPLYLQTSWHSWHPPSSAPNRTKVALQASTSPTIRILRHPETSVGLPRPQCQPQQDIVAWSMATETCALVLPWQQQQQQQQAPAKLQKLENPHAKTFIQQVQPQRDINWGYLVFFELLLLELSFPHGQLLRPFLPKSYIS
ncbi:hypothetical protein SODALDRAFT_358324 [Sodiomyces alkalinus F11]|uniref:Uncharacterized protein n=1 Tax=Sodiomyces alkalinus (strain CBS 110278 / VKM F-3762 / F11) TaxID=1314773 RepID=A0A3N2PZP5_SODAK|nr:hypothetical protein SODALDRAFT_358324 [Sodiomyces alkalinus F11]ROT39908.1 hypothetical protein SODALDRAFT_358324 [Sodiomyces alkalinus F11]